MKKSIILAILCMLVSTSRVYAIEDRPCPAQVFTSGQSVTTPNELVARYGSQHGSPGRFTINAGESVTLTGEAVCEAGSWWWTVSNGRWDGFVPENGAFSLTENDPFGRVNGPGQKTERKNTTQSTTTVRTRTCSAVATPTLAPGTRVVQILAGCLNLRASPEIRNGNLVGTARNGSRFRLAADPIANWFLITVPGLGDVWAARGNGDTLSRQIQ